MQLRLNFVDPIQRRYEVIRPLVLWGEGTALQRAQETRTHPDTVRTWARRFRQHGMPGLLAGDASPPTDRKPTLRLPDAVRQEVDRLKTLSGDLHYRELARILSRKLHRPISDKTAKRLWQRSPVVPQAPRPFQTYHTAPDRVHARLQVLALFTQGWATQSMSRFLHVSRPPVDRWLQRGEAEEGAGLQDKRHGPKAPARKVWLPLMREVSHLQHAHPDAGEFRIWSLLARPDLSVRTVGRILALNKRLYPDIPHGRQSSPTHPAQPHPYKATRHHPYWFIDGRQMDLALDGVQWWSLAVLEGDSRASVAGAIVPAEATGAAFMVLYAACLHYGSPATLVSDSGGAFTSNACEAVWHRLQIHHEPIISTHGESSTNLLETHFNIQRRLYDYQFALTRTPIE